MNESLASIYQKLRIPKQKKPLKHVSTQSSIRIFLWPGVRCSQGRAGLGQGSRTDTGRSRLLGNGAFWCRALSRGSRPRRTALRPGPQREQRRPVHIVNPRPIDERAASPWHSGCLCVRCRSREELPLFRSQRSRGRGGRVTPD